MMYKGKVFILSAISLVISTQVFAAKKVELQHQSVDILKPYLQSMAFAGDQLVEVQRSVDFNQTTHIRLQQTYEGVPVLGGDVILHVPKGGKTALTAVSGSQSTMNGTWYDNIKQDLGIAPQGISDTARSQKALQEAKTLFQKKSKEGVITQEKVTRVIYMDNDNKAHRAFLVSFLVKAKGLPKKPTYILDANTFKVYEEWDNIQTLDDVDGGGFGGNEKMGKLTYDGSRLNYPVLQIKRDAFGKTCYLENSEVTVKNVKKNDAVSQFDCAVPNNQHNGVYWDGDEDAANGGYSPSNDALYVGKMVKNMYMDWYGIPVLIDHGRPEMLNMRVHEDMDNAYWDGEQMTFGDGITMFYPLVSLDVGGHEISHGFTEQHSNLVYHFQSGGLNESFSDMAGEAVKFYSRGSNDWEVGTDITKDGEALRYLDDPTKDCGKGQQPGNGCSIDNVNDYNFTLNVHYSSGVFNKAFYLIATTSGWNTKKAFDVMVQANQHYWTSRSDFTNAACGVLSATKDYKYDTTPVKHAFSAVGIDVSRC